MTSVSVRIPHGAYLRAQRLATEESNTLGAIVEIALIRYERDRKLGQYSTDIARLRADPVAWAHWQAETKLWDSASFDGLEDYPYEGIEELKRDEVKDSTP